MKNTLLVLLSLIMIVSCSNSEYAYVITTDETFAVAKKVEKIPAFRDGLFYEYLSPNLANGQYEIYYQNGQLKERATYKDGKADGIFETYFENGQLKWRHTYKDGIQEGLFLGYLENGQLSWRHTYKDGKEEGLYVRYNKDGTLESKCFWVNGKKYECE